MSTGTGTARRLRAVKVYGPSDGGGNTVGTEGTSMVTDELRRLIIARRDELGLSYRDIEARSGGLLKKSTVGNLVSGSYRFTVSDDVIRGLALALSLSETAVRRAAGVRDTPLPEFVLPPRANKLGPEGRRAVLRVLDAVLDLEQALTPPDRDDTSTVEG